MKSPEICLKEAIAEHLEERLTQWGRRSDEETGQEFWEGFIPGNNGLPKVKSVPLPSEDNDVFVQTERGSDVEELQNKQVNLQILEREKTSRTLPVVSDRSDVSVEDDGESHSRKSPFPFMTEGLPLLLEIDKIPEEWRELYRSLKGLAKLEEGEKKLIGRGGFRKDYEVAAKISDSLPEEYQDQERYIGNKDGVSKPPEELVNLTRRVADNLHQRYKVSASLLTVEGVLDVAVGADPLIAGHHTDSKCGDIFSQEEAFCVRRKSNQALADKEPTDLLDLGINAELVVRSFEIQVYGIIKAGGFYDTANIDGHLDAAYHFRDFLTQTDLGEDERLLRPRLNSVVNNLTRMRSKTRNIFVRAGKWVQKRVSLIQETFDP
jgi:hypothetical protein